MSIASSNTLGCIDGIFHDKLVGWFHSSEFAGSKPTLMVNGSPVQMALIKTGVSRVDVASSFGIGNDSGFEIDLKVISSNSKVSTVSLIHDESGFDFNSEKLAYCPVVAKYRQKIRNIFSPEFYRYRYGHANLNNDQAFEQYIRFGIYANLNPNPWFSNEYIRLNHAEDIKGYDLPVIAYIELEYKLQIAASSVFDARYYIKANSNIQRQDEIMAHYVQNGSRERLACVKNLIPDQVREELRQLSAIEPELQKVDEKVNNLASNPYLSSRTYMPALIKCQCKQQPQAIVCVPYLSLGGADLIATYLLSALEKHYGVDEVLMIVTDRCDVLASKWINSESNIIYLEEGADILSMTERAELLHSVVGYLRPKKVINVNSNACWEMYRNYGFQLSRYIELDAYLFCFDYNQQGDYAGYITDFIPQTIGYLKSVFCDNATIIKDIQNLYGFADSDALKFHAVHVPAPTNLRAVDIKLTGEYSKPILWIGRLARQKRPELLLQVAERLSNQKFVVYGPMGDSPESIAIVEGTLRNIEYRGVYTNFDELDLSEFSLYLNTSAWEGLPTIIIQIMSAGLPVLTSNVGGIAELVSENTGWLVPDGNNPESYVTEIRKILLKPQIAHSRAEQGRTLTQKNHSWDSFTKALTDAGCFDVSGKSRVPEEGDVNATLVG